MLLRKSNNRCSHCGKMLTLETVTCDHVIPISKGSDNDYKNMVALCEKCNQEKADTIIIDSLGFYYKYLNQNYLEQTIRYADEYIKDKDWVTYRNFMPSDITYFVGDRQVFNEDFLKYRNRIKYQPKYILKHADYSDLNDLLDFWEKRYKKFRGTADYKSRAELKDIIMNNFLVCGIYIIISGASKEIIGTYTVSFERSSVYDNVTIPEISCLAINPKHRVLLANMVNNQVVRLQNSINIAGSSFEISVAKTETGAIESMEYLRMITKGSFYRLGETETCIIYATQFTNRKSMINRKVSEASLKDTMKRSSRVFEKYLMKRNKALKDMLPKKKYEELMELLWMGEIDE